MRFRRGSDTALRAQAVGQWEQWIAAAPGGTGSFLVAVFGPKDPKTSTAVAIATTLVRLRGGLVLAVCANPDFGTLRSRLLGPQTPRTSRSLVDLAHALTHPDPAMRLQVHALDDLAPYLERGPGGLLVASNDGVDVAQVYQLSTAQWSAVFDTLRRHVNVMVVDEGRSQVGPIADGLLQAADHLVVPMPTSPREVNDIVKPGDGTGAGAGALAQVAARGHSVLVARCTAVITALRPGADPDFIADRLNHSAGTFYGHAVAVPYDPAVTDPALGPVTAGTRLGYALLTAHVVQAMNSPRLSLTRGSQPTGPYDHGANGNGTGWAGVNGDQLPSAHGLPVRTLDTGGAR